MHGYPPIVQGNKPWDGGYLILSAEERNEFLTKHPESEKYIKPFIGSYEFINGKERYCLWLKGISPTEYRGIPEVMERLKGVADTRRKTKTVAVQTQAEPPCFFHKFVSLIQIIWQFQKYLLKSGGIFQLDSRHQTLLQATNFI